MNYVNTQCFCFSLILLLGTLFNSQEIVIHSVYDALSIFLVQFIADYTLCISHILKEDILNKTYTMIMHV